MPDVTRVVDGWRLHVAAHELSRGEVTRRLEPKAMQVLVRLAASPGTVVSRTELLDTIWGGAFVGDDALSATIIKLRKAFGDNARSPRVIETVHKSGYRLIAEVAGVDTAAAQPDEADPVKRRSKVTVGTLARCVFRLELPEGTSIDPEEWKDVTDLVVASIGDVIRRHGGRPIRESDAVNGVFGAPVAQEHHATRGVRAAIAIRQALNAMAGRRPGTYRVSWRLALASGELLWAENSAHGDPVQRVAILNEAARPGDVLLTRETVELADGLTQTRMCEARPPFIGPNEVAVLDGDAQWRTPWEDRPVTPLVGRDHEVGRMEALVEAARGGRGRVVALCGEPGSGKSRLVRETLRRLSAGECTSHVASASPLEARTPFYPLWRSLMARLQVDPHLLRDGAALRRHLERLGSADIADAAALLAVLRPEHDEDGWLHVSPEDRRNRCLAALADALVDGRRLTVLVFEDLQWADEPTLSFITSVVNTLARRPLLVIVTYRPGFADPWTAKSYHSQLRVEPLRDADSLRILDHLVGDDPSVQPWKSAVIAKSDGTPLFAEEVVRSARSAGTLRGDLGELTLVPRSGRVEVPASIHAVVAERLDKLSDDAQHLLSLAAVVGRDVPADLLEALTADTATDNRAYLDELQAAELLYDAGFQREPGYVFKHALTQEVAYRALPQSRRRSLHRRVADLLESGGIAMAQVSPELIARHRSGAGQHAVAVEAWLRAARAATAAAAFADALDHLDQARSALLHADPGEQDRLGLLIALSAGGVLVQSLGPADDEVERTYLYARELAAAAGTPRQEFEAGWGLWFVQLMRGDINTAQPLAAELFELSEVLDDALRLEAHHMQWAGRSLAGDVVGAKHHAEIGIARYQSARHHWLTYSYGGHDPGVCAYNLGATALWLLGESDQAREGCTSAMNLATRLGHPYTQLEASNGALNIALLDGDAESLRKYAQQIQNLAREGKLPSEAYAYADGYRAYALVISGDIETGLPLLESAAPTWQAFWGAWCFPLDTAFAAALAQSGQIGRALAYLDERLAVAERSGAHWWHAEFHRLRGDLLRTTGSGEAEVSLRTAVDIARRQKAALLERRAATSLAAAGEAAGTLGRLADWQ